MSDLASAVSRRMDVKSTLIEALVHAGLYTGCFISMSH